MSKEKNVDSITIEQTMADSFLDYSMSVITARALPDARDGLKPIHRKIIYAMYVLGITSKSSYKKCARIIGDVIGKYSPHGDTASYDALVRMAQDFSLHSPLIDGQGNFGSIDGDNAAAMRYTESRLTSITEEMLSDLPYNAVKFIPNYDDSTTEPSVLPTRIPNLLLNGSTGIAVGMSTIIPPHNLSELVDACIMLIRKPDTTVEELTNIVKGPDFPTGGIIYGEKGIKDYLITGRGKINLRAVHTTYEDKRGNQYITITELPYMVNKSKLIIDIANLAKLSIVEGISDIRDDSDRRGISIVIKVKRGHNLDIVLRNLYKHSNLSVSISPKMVAVVDKEPKLLNLKDALSIFLNHRTGVIIRVALFELEKLRKRLHIIEALITAVNVMDKVIKTIRSSKTEVVALARLKDLLKLDEVQINAIFRMQLRQLTGLELDKLKSERKELTVRLNELEKLLRSRNAISKITIDQLLEVKTKHNIPRRTEITHAVDEIRKEDLIPNDSMVITITHRGYIKRVPNSTYGTQARGGTGKKGLTLYDDDFIEDHYSTKMHDTLLLISNLGTMYRLKVYDIPEGSTKAKGKALVNLVSLVAGEYITNIIPVQEFTDDKNLVFFTRNGIIKMTNLSLYSNLRVTGIKGIKLNPDDSLVTVRIMDKKDKYFMIGTHKAMGIRCRVTDVRTTGRDTVGVIGIKLHEDDYVVGGQMISDLNSEIFIVSSKGIGKKTLAKDFKLQSRGGKGTIIMDIKKPRVGTVISIDVTTNDKDVMCLTSDGNMVRIDVSKIKPIGRRTVGVRLVNVKSGTVVSANTCEKEVEDDE